MGSKLVNERPLRLTPGESLPAEETRPNGAGLPHKAGKSYARALLALQPWRYATGPRTPEGKAGSPRMVRRGRKENFPRAYRLGSGSVESADARMATTRRLG